MSQKRVNILYCVVITYAYSNGSALQSTQLGMNKRSAMQTASYGNVVFVEIVADVSGGVVFEVKRHHAGGLGRIKSHVLDLLESVEQFACQISGIE